MPERPDAVVSLEDVQPVCTERGRSRFERRQLGQAAGSQQLGVSHLELEPGARSYPFHWHAANEEAVYVLEGAGTLRLGEERVAVRAGDYIALPVGPGHAHQLINDSEAPLRYLCISTMHPVEIGGYPDSDKLWVMGGSAPGADPSARFLSRVGRLEDADYWDGET